MAAIVSVRIYGTLIRFEDSSADVEVRGGCPELEIGEQIFFNGRGYDVREEESECLPRVGLFEVASKSEIPGIDGGLYERSYTMRAVDGWRGDDAIRRLVTERDSLTDKVKYIETDHTWGHIQKVI